MASLPTTMKALVVEKVGAPPEIRNDIPVPVPSDTQILVKSIYTAVNPVDALLSTTGMLVESFPLVPGCDAGGIVVQAGSRAFSPLGPLFKPGGQVFGCTRLGSWGYSPWQEYHLLDAHITLPKPSTITLAQASTLGVSLLTASLGIFSSLEIPLPPTSTTTKTSTSTPTPQWALLLGGASSVGKSALQLFKASGYLVLATCSPKDSETLKNLGADETLDYKTDAATLIANIKKITNGGQDILYAFDAVASNNSLVSELFNALSPPVENALLRRYTTTNDWDPLPTSTSTPPTFTSSPIALGLIGRDAELDKKLTSYIPSLVRLFEEGKIKPSEYSVEGEGIEGIGKAWDVQKSGRMGGTKVVVKIADEE